MNSKRPIFRASTRKLLIRTYCWGLIPVVGMALYWAEGSFVKGSVCNLARPAERSYQSPGTTASLTPKIVARMLPVCCTGAAPVSFVSARLSPAAADAIPAQHALAGAALGKKIPPQMPPRAASLTSYNK